MTNLFFPHLRSGFARAGMKKLRKCRIRPQVKPIPRLQVNPSGSEAMLALEQQLSWRLLIRFWQKFLGSKSFCRLRFVSVCLHFKFTSAFFFLEYTGELRIFVLRRRISGPLQTSPPAPDQAARGWITSNGCTYIKTKNKARPKRGQKLLELANLTQTEG